VCREHPSTNPQLWYIPYKEQEELMAELRKQDSYVREIGVKIKTTNDNGGGGEYMWVYFNNGEDPPAESNVDRDMERKFPPKKYTMSEEERELYLKIQAEESKAERAQKLQDYEDGREGAQEGVAVPKREALSTEV
jgi:hypothetical protein